MTPEQLRELIPDSWSGVTAPLSAEQQKNLGAYYRHVQGRRVFRDDETEFEGPPADYERHTVDIDRQPMSVEDETSVMRLSGFAAVWALWAVLTGLVLGCIIGGWWAHTFGSCHGG